MIAKLIVPAGANVAHTTQALPSRFSQQLIAVAVASACSFVLNAQTAPAAPESAKKESTQKKDDVTLKPVVVKETADAQLGKDSIRATTTTIGKGQQALRDIPQSVTVVTEKLIDDRNLDTLRDVLHNAAGATFLAAEGGEEDIRLRGFSLATTGDIFLDGMRDAAFYDRDTFNLDRADILRGSASMLFGRGSTGGVVNQNSKLPHGVTEREVSLTVGNYNYRRVVADINQKTGEDAALRLVAMHTKADNNGSGSSIEKQGVAGSYRYGIGTSDEFLASIYYLNNQNGMNYGLPWIRPLRTDTSASNTIISSLSPDAYYGMASDYNNGKATIGTLSYTHRFSRDTEIKTQLRQAAYERDQRASAIRFAAVPNNPPNTQNSDLATFGPSTAFTRGSNLKIQNLDTSQLQSELSSKFSALGMKHYILAGFDYSRDERDVFAARSATQGGVTLTKPTTLSGTPFDGASVDEAARVLRVSNDFVSKALGVFAQDMIEVTPTWKVVAGLRWDKMDGTYNAYAIPNAAPEPTTKTTYSQKISEMSKRIGVLYQPNDLYSFHFSYGTSFNTSGDTYSYNALSANTPPESSVNLELGAKIDTPNKQFSARIALFRSEKRNERNTDPDTAATRLLLSGKRHTAGVELDLSGRITSAWEAYLSYMWMPTARVDEAASTSTTVGNRVGDRPGLSPKHSGSVWTTYQWTPQIRTGAGVNFRSKQAPADVTAPAWNAPSYATFDLMAEYKFNDRYSLRANVNNLTDKLYADSLYRGHYIPGAGRLMQLNFTAAF